MIGYYAHIEELTKNNTFFRHVLYTGPHHQLVLMSLLPSEEIGMEVHPYTTSFSGLKAGKGKSLLLASSISFATATQRSFLRESA